MKRKWRDRSPPYGGPVWQPVFRSAFRFSLSQLFKRIYRTSLGARSSLASATRWDLSWWCLPASSFSRKQRLLWSCR